MSSHLINQLIPFPVQSPAVSEMKKIKLEIKLEVKLETYQAISSAMATFQASAFGSHGRCERTVS